MSGEALAVGLAVERGLLGVVLDGRQWLPVHVDIDLHGRGRERATDWRREASPVGDAYVGAAGPLRLRVSADTRRGGLRTRWRVEAGDSRVRLSRGSIGISALARLWPGAAGAVRGLRLAYCGAHSRSESSRSYVQTLTHEGSLRGWWACAIGSERAGAGLAFGALDFRRFVTGFDMSPDRVAAVQALEGWSLDPGETVDLAPLWLGFTSGPPFDALEKYADEVAAVHAAAPRHPPCGWGSWGHFLERIDADLMRETVLALEGTPSLQRAVQLVQIDDGWSELLETGRVSASWRPNERFPSGIAPLAAEIARSGRACGLWILPFAANPGSALVEEHPEFLVGDSDGNPLRIGAGDSYCLDPTHPGARDWLTRVFSQIRDWGVRYVKLDFLRALLAPEPDGPTDSLDAPRRYHSARTRTEAYRRGLELIREVVGPDTFIVACSAPAGPGAGLVDAHRVGPDVEAVWSGRVSGIRDVAQSLSANYFWHGRTWVNDPDYLLPCESISATRFWATMVAFSGGSVVLSADIGDLPRWQEDIFAFVTPPVGIAARPLDLFASIPGPRLWQLKLGGGGRTWQLVALFNWDDHPQDVELDLVALGLDGPVHVWDCWRQRHRMVRRAATFNVESEGVTLLRLTAANEMPQVIGTDIHFGQGLHELADEAWDSFDRRLTVRSGETFGRSGHAFVWYPRSVEPVYEAGAEVLWPQILRIPLRLPAARTIVFSDADTRGRAPEV